MDKNETTLALMPDALREAVQQVTGVIEADVYYNAHRKEALIWYVADAENEHLISVTFYPETGETYTTETTVSSEWTTGFEA